MDFDERPEHAAFRAEAREWLDRHLDEAAARDLSRRAGGPGDEWVARAKVWQATLAEHRWAGIAWPVEYGGRGRGPTEARIFAEECAARGATVNAFVVGVGMAGPTLIAHGTEEQKRRYLPPMLRGDEVWCQLFSEPGAGSDLAGLATRAVRDGDEWVVNGQKVWTSGAHYSDFGILLARTDPDAPKHRGITYFVVDMRSPGIEIRPLRQMTGASHFSEVFLTDVRVPHANVVGEVDRGWGVAMTTLANERTFMGGGSPGPGLADLVALVQKRDRSTDPLVRQEVAAAHARAEAMRFLGLRARTKVERGEPLGPEASVQKLAAAHNLKHRAELAVAAQGPAGMLVGDDAPDEGRWQQQMLTAPSIRIAGGSDEVQRNVLGERILGLPGEPRVDKDVPWRATLRPTNAAPSTDPAADGGR